jgi:protein-tyrosine phosphatase
VIDIHSHILPGIDDGPENIADSIEIIRKAGEQGVQTLVATPHIFEPQSESSWQEIYNIFNDLKRSLFSEKIDVELILGAEIFISPDLPQQLIEISGLSINNNNKYVLLEFPLYEIPPFSEETLFKLILKGIIPIIAHPERYVEIQRDIGKLYNLVRNGALTQVNAGSLIGKYGKSTQKTVREMLAHNLVHMIGSDVHSLSRGTYPLLQSLNHAAKVVGLQRAKEFVTVIPRKVIDGEILEVLPFIPAKKSIFRKLFG